MRKSRERLNCEEARADADGLWARYDAVLASLVLVLERAKGGHFPPDAAVRDGYAALLQVVCEELTVRRLERSLADLERLTRDN